MQLSVITSQSSLLNLWFGAEQVIYVWFITFVTVYVFTAATGNLDLDFDKTIS